jgi:DNA-directed RNA polymerase subunit alpha
LGNAIRRTHYLTASSITGARINNLKHEFSVVEGLREDVLEVLLNLKEIVFKTLFLQKTENFHPKLKGF